MKNKVCFCGIEEHCGYQIETDMEQHDKEIYEQGYNKAIDDFLKEICKKYTEEERKQNFKQYCCSIKQELADLAQQLKEGAVDD
jgi:hypothetical protein